MNNQELESYLAILEKALSRVSVAGRAEVITKVRKAISVESTETGASLSEIVSKMGTPKQVAEKYLIEMGIAPEKPRNSFFKWLVIGTLGLFFIGSITIGVLVWKFSPIYEVDATTGQMKFFGGAIDIKPGDTANWSFATSSIGTKFSGTRPVIPGEKVKLLFENGNLELAVSNDDEVHYQCNSLVDLSPLISGVNFYFKGESIDCQLMLPKGSEVEISGTQGRIILDKIESHVELDLARGSVEVETTTAINYNYTLSVEKGTIDRFEHSSLPDAYKIKIKLESGAIRKN